MRFSFTEDQEAIRETARRFAAERIAPGYMARDNEDRIDRDLIREMGSLGLIASSLPETYGGIGADSVTMGIIAEQIAYADFNLCYVSVTASLMGGILATYANSDAVREWLPKFSAGESILGLGLTEPRGGSDAANIVLKAERSGNGYVINGEKTSISFCTQMDAIILFARTGTAEDGARGVSAFFVPMDDPGVSRSGFNDSGSRVIGRGSLFFDNVRVPADYLLGEEGTGFVQIMQGFDFSRALLGLQCLGSAQASLDETWTHVAEREAFGAPLAQYQGVSFPLAEAETRVNAARLVCYETLDRRDRGLSHTSQAAMAKWLAPRTAFEAVHQCLLTHGHAGFSMDLPHQQRLRDIVGLEIGDGTEQIMKLIIAREKVGRIAVQYAKQK